MICATCHQGFCLQHVHHRGGRKYICEFCFLLEQARGSSQKRSKRVGYLICLLIVASGILILILGLSNVLAVVLIMGGGFGVAGMATSRSMLPRPTRATDIEADSVTRRVFGEREDQ